MNWYGIVRRITGKITLVVFLVVLTVVTGTSSVFNDEEVSPENNILSTSLDIGLSQKKALDSQPLVAGSSTSSAYLLSDLGLLPPQFDLQFKYESGNQLVCDALEVSLEEKTYSGGGVVTNLISTQPLNTFIASDSAMIFPVSSYETNPEYTDTQHWYQANFHLPSDSGPELKNSSCTFNIASHAWQPELGPNHGGFTDTESLTQTIYTGDWCSAGPTAAASVASVVTGTTKNDQPITDPARIDPQKALGDADGQFYSLGKNGSLTIKFAYPITNVAGTDFTVQEISTNRTAAHEEKALIAVSQDGTHWITFSTEAKSTTNGNGLSSFDLEELGFDWIQYVKLTDSTDFSIHPDHHDGFDIDAIEATYGTCQKQEATCYQVSGQKIEDGTDQGLSGWEIPLIHQTDGLVQTLDLQSSDPNGVNTNSLDTDVWYRIEVSGTWTNRYTSDTPQLVDANYYSEDNWVTVNDYDDTDEYDHRIIDVVIDDQDINWGSYNSQHSYSYFYKGTGAPLNLKVSEAGDPNPPSWYQDNQGQLNIKVYRATETMMSGEDGNFSSSVCLPAGEYQLHEIQKEGWHQVDPIDPPYYQFTLPKDQDNQYIFTNRQTPQIALNEIYQDSDNHYEWIELYNNTDSDIDVSGWKIFDNSSSDTLPPGSIIPASSFAVIVTDQPNANTITEINLHGATIITVPGYIGNGMSSTSGVVTLKDTLDQTIDEVSWGNSGDTITSIPSGQSINRNPLGIGPWEGNTTPNPGTNPHSHIKPVVTQDEQYLNLSFENAYGFNSVKYSISYNHQVEGVVDPVHEVVTKDAQKPADATELILDPVYIGTCSTTDCTPHTDITGMVINLLYKLNNQILGTSVINVDWQEVTP